MRCTLVSRCKSAALSILLPFLLCSAPSDAALSLSIGGIPQAEAVIGTGYSFAPSLAAVTSTGYRFEIENKPEWAGFDPIWGRLSGTPDTEHAGLYPDIRISLVGAGLRVSLPVFSIIVQSRAPHSSASSATRSALLSWTAPIENTDESPLLDLAGFVVYAGIDPYYLSPTATIPDPSAISFTLNGLPIGTNYFAVAAYNRNGEESDLSTVVGKILE